MAKGRSSRKDKRDRVGEFKNSWRSIWTLIKLQFKAGVKLPRGKSRGMTILKFALIIGVGILGIVGFNLIYGMLAQEFINNRDRDLSHEFLVFTFVIFHIIQTCFMLPKLIRTLDINNDREMLLRWPVSPKQIFISKVIVAYMDELIFSTIILFPVLISFGVTVGLGVGYFFLIPFVVLVAPFFPFFLASLIMYPVQRVVNFLRSRQLLTTFIYFGLLIGMIFLYMRIINDSLFAIIAEDGMAVTIRDSQDSIVLWSQIFGIQWLFASIFTQGAAWAFVGLLLVLVLSLFLLVVGLFAAGSNYYKTYMDERTSFSALKKKAPFKQYKPLYATIKKDCLNIFRSSNYTFQFLLLVILTPLLVYFCNRVAMTAAFHTFTQAQAPERAWEIVFGASLFVIMILMPVSSSFAASAITREGHNIYHTKLIPVSFRKQLAIKAGIVFFPILISVAVAVGMIMVPYMPHDLALEYMYVSFNDAAYIFGLALCMAIGYICLGMYLDLRKPLCSQVGGSELVKSTSHINLIMGVGLGVGAILGILSMFGGFFGDLSFILNLGWFVEGLFSIGSNAKAIYLPLAATFAVVSVFLLFVVGPKKYYRLEQ